MLNRLNVRYTMAVRCSSKGINHAIAAIPDDAWTPIEYTADGEAEVAECDYTTGAGKKKVTRRLVVRRTRLTDIHQLKFWPDWRHFAFLTDLDATAVELDQFHRCHTVVELAIRDLKECAGLEHAPSGNFQANSAWLQCAVLAHNMIRWTAIAGKVRVDNQLVVARTLRTRLLGSPAGSSTAPDDQHFECRPTGHGQRRSRQRSTRYADSSPPPAETRSCGPARRAPITKRRQPTNAPPSASQRPRTRQPPHRHQPSSPPTHGRLLKELVGGSRLKDNALAHCPFGRMRRGSLGDARSQPRPVDRDNRHLVLLAR